MDSDRMQVPSIESQRPTLVPPAPYSIPPLGFDVRPPKEWNKERLAIGAFIMGALVGGLFIGALRTAWLERLTGVTPPNIVKAAAAPPVVCPEIPAAAAAPAVTPSEAVSATDTTADGAAASAKTTKATPHRHIAHAAKQAPTLSTSASSDEAFMRAIRASAH